MTPYAAREPGRGHPPDDAREGVAAAIPEHHGGQGVQPARQEGERTNKQTNVPTVLFFFSNEEDSRVHVGEKAYRIDTLGEKVHERANDPMWRVEGGMTEEVKAAPADIKEELG
eukprot:49348-Prorocentrum_minimum.AAC.2